MVEMKLMKCITLGSNMMTPILLKYLSSLSGSLFTRDKYQYCTSSETCML